METQPTSAPKKARSRLQRQKRVRASKNDRSVDWSKILGKYVRYSPLLAITLLLVWQLNKVIHTVDPNTWQHTITPNSYSPMLILISSIVFFGSSYLLLNTGRGFRLSLATFTYFFLKFQNVEITPKVIIGICSIVFLLELLSQLYNRKASRNSSANSV